MVRFAAAILAGVASLPMSVGAVFAADPPQFRLPGAGAAEARPHLNRGPQAIGHAAGAAQPRYDYYGAYQYPVPFGYGYAYAPVRRHGFEYGYYGPRYAW